MAVEREVAGLRCGEVLAELSDFLDGDLPGERRRRMEAHLLGCEECARFGGAFTTALQSLRSGKSGPPGEAESVFQRLRVWLDLAVGRPSS